MLEFSYLTLYPEYVLFRESDLVRFSVARCQEWPVLAHSYTVVSECKVALSRCPTLMWYCLSLCLQDINVNILGYHNHVNYFENFYTCILIYDYNSNNYLYFQNFVNFNIIMCMYICTSH